MPAVRVLTALLVVAQPGYTGAYYYIDVARRLAHGQGLSADFVWNFMEAPGLVPLPMPSHRFWMPVASVEPAIGITFLEAAHFSGYDDLYRGRSVLWLGPPIESAGVKIFPVRARPPC